MSTHLSYDSRNGVMLPSMADYSKLIFGLMMETRIFGRKVDLRFFLGGSTVIHCVHLLGQPLPCWTDSLSQLWKKQSFPFLKCVFLSSGFSRQGHKDLHLFFSTLGQPNWSWSQDHHGCHGVGCSLLMADFHHALYAGSDSLKERVSFKMLCKDPLLVKWYIVWTLSKTSRRPLRVGTARVALSPFQLVLRTPTMIFFFFTVFT